MIQSEANSSRTPPRQGRPSTTPVWCSRPFPVLAIAVVLGVWLSSGSAADTESTRLPAESLAALSLEQVLNLEVASVYGASKYEQKVTRAPSSVSIVTADDIQKFGYRTLNDVLAGVRGFSAASDRNYSYISVRGFLRPGDYNTRVLVLVDGHRLNDNIYDAAYGDRGFMVDMDTIERVEIIRGPSSSIYGNSAFFGVINVVTKRGRDMDGGEVSAEAGSNDTYGGRFTFGEKFKNDLEVMISGSFYTSAGWDRLYYREFDQRVSSEPRARDNGLAHGRDGEDAFTLLGSAAYGEFSLAGFYGERRKDVPTASYGTLFNAGERTRDRRAYVNLQWTHEFGTETRLAGTVRFDHYEYDGWYPYDYAEPGDPPLPVSYQDGALGEWFSTDWQLTRTLFDRHTLVLGVEYREHFNQEQETFDVLGGVPLYWNDTRANRDLGLFAQADVALRTNLWLNAGVRYDNYFEGFGDTVNPRVGVIYSPWGGTTFKVLYGEAFRAPNLYEAYYYSEQRAQPALSPETIRTAELVWEQDLPRKHRLAVTGYYYTVEDLITQTETEAGNLYFANLEEARAAGAELEVEGDYAGGLRARASYGLQRAEDDDGAELSASPRHLAKLNLQCPLYQDRIFAGVELQYTSSLRTLAGRRADEFLIANATLFSRELVKGLEFSASVYNLFDTDYGYPGGAEHAQDVIVQDGRTFRLKLTYRF